jgi:pyridoxamine 5'-phosphate oxidase
MNDLYSFRKEYIHSHLNESELLDDPLLQFHLWLEDALKTNIEEPTATVLSTVNKKQQPSSRIVLLKKVDESGLSFFTNYNSRKAQEIEVNPKGALLFPWHEMERQVRIEGIIEKVSDKESQEYFQHRPAGSRIGAWASPQSKVIPSREHLEQLESELKKQFTAESIPRPPHWGGYRLIPHLYEFWQGRENRLHDRIEYTLEKGKWIIRRLAP